MTFVMSEPETITRSFRIPIDLYRAIEARAAAEDRPVNAQVVRVLRKEFLPDTDPTATGGDPAARDKPE